MVGLPGAGKTTALLSTNRQEFRRFPTGGFGDRRTIVFRASTSISRLLEHPSIGVRRLLSDSWGAGVIASNVQLFSTILQLVNLIPEGSRHREIILNYWRERIARQMVISEISSKKIALTDEGLIQTLLSTVIRTKGLDPKDGAAIDLVRQVVLELPHIDAVYQFHVGRDRIAQRLPRTQLHWALGQRTEDWLSRIFLISVEAGINVRKIDASLSAEEIQQQLSNPMR